jgi:betaine-aldehyde dehydrogenase
LPIPQRELFINGRWVQPVRGKYLDVVSPTTESVIGRIAAGSVEDVEAAVAAAVAAHKNGSWVRSSGKQRAVVLRALAEKVGSVKLWVDLSWEQQGRVLGGGGSCAGMARCQYSRQHKAC